MSEELPPIEAGQLWICDESRADDPRFERPWPEPGPRFVRFHARVEDHVAGAYVALVVTRRNGHPKAPAPGAEVVETPDTLRTDARWTLERMDATENPPDGDGVGSVAHG